MRRRLAGWALTAAVLGLAGCSESPAGGAPARPAAPPAVPVGAATAQERSVPVQVITVGTVQAYTTVGVKSQVAGQIDQVHFTEGQEVRRGDLLFTIDPRPLQAGVRQMEANVAKDRAALRQAEAAFAQRQAEVTQALANLERDQAQLENARVQEQRYAALVAKELVAREQYDQVRTALAALQATVNADRAAVDNARASARAAEAMVDNARAAIQANEATVETARLQLAYTTIRAPMDGRTGNLLVQGGNVVKSTEDNPLVVIAQIRPIYVSFAVPEQHLTAVKKYRAEGALKVEAVLDGGRRSVVGAVTFMNNTVDASTGTIQLKATFPNTDNALWPGQFVDVALTLTSERAVLVPTQAVQAGQQGPYVFVVKPDSTVESRSVKVGRRLAREVVIEQGVQAGEQVVTDGQLRLVPGARVEIKPSRPS
ncbi:MAG: efflux RND transporter periplasmic adaptor subunit [Candidatus Rokuibacteriota bacterium]|nr:MAG: efflux RND transporter periplasmic adaptor subunit [Candidatus Rokubacteria bacterium]